MSNEADSGLSEETVMYVIYDTFNISTLLLTPEICRFKTQRKTTDLIIVNPKRRRYLKNNSK